jgi:predicted nucleic acid-binding protein
MIIADNSVVVGLAFPNDAYHADALAARRRDPEWFAPDLILSEIRSVGAGYLRKGERLSVVLAMIDNATAAVVTHTVWHGEVMGIVAGSNLSAYDAEYVALALRLNCPFVTTDRRILAAFPQIAVRLEDFASRSV